MVDEMMNYARFQAILKGQSAAAQKVYGAIPEATGWTHNEIQAELIRKGCNTEYRIIQGCVNSLIASGIVREFIPPHTHGEPKSAPKFKREMVRGRPKKTLDIQDVEEIQPEEPEMANPIPFKAPPSSPIDLLTAMSSRLRGIAKDMETLATDIDNTALKLEENNAENAAVIAKARQLKQLLGEL